MDVGRGTRRVTHLLESYPQISRNYKWRDFETLRCLVYFNFISQKILIDRLKGESGRKNVGR